MGSLLKTGLAGVATMAGVGAACVAYGTFVESVMFAVRNYEVAILPPGREPIRVLHISDIHATAWNRRRLQFLESLAGLKPDLVVSTGDHHAYRNADAPLLAALDGLLDIPGYFVYGSNDYFEPHFKNPLSYLTGKGKHKPTPDHAHEEFKASLEERGWRYIAHLRDHSTIRGTCLEFRGTDDAHIRRDDYPTVAGPASSGVEVSVGITHAPYTRILDAMTNDDVDLLFAGHTHGGQVCVPGYGALISNCDLPPSLASGLHQWQGMWFEISAGMGMSPFAPYRFACRPEASLVTLTSAPAL